MKHQLALIVLLLVSLGCGGGGTPSGMLSIAGSWSGQFQSSNGSLGPFTVTAAINEDSSGNLAATASFAQLPCLTSATLKGAIAGLNITLAGSDTLGDNVSFKGTSNNGGTQLSLSYILNAGASGRCETDSGTGVLTRQ